MRLFASGQYSAGEEQTIISVRRDGRVDQVALSRCDQTQDLLRLFVAGSGAFSALQLLKLFKREPRLSGKGCAKEKKVYNGVLITSRKTSANRCVMTRNPGRPHCCDIVLAL